MRDSDKFRKESREDLICLNLSGELSFSLKEQIRIYGEAGFDGFFSGWEKDLVSLREEAERRSMLFQSVHAPFTGIDRLWSGEEADEMEKLLVQCIDDTAHAGVSTIVFHAYIGFEVRHPITEKGTDRFRRLVARAGESGIKVAFENTEGEEYLAHLLNSFSGLDNVGFCLDTGHELCYNRGKDLLSLYGDRLIATHLNDNLGISSDEGKITWLDDLHLLPFDGIIDWKDVAYRLDREGYDGPMTFELKKSTRRGKKSEFPYREMSDEEYISEAYSRASRFAKMRKSGSVTQ